MVCFRCVMAVEDILKNDSISFQKIDIGEVHLDKELSDSQINHLKIQLEKIGFELIDNNGSRLIEKTKQLVIKKARNEVENDKMKIKLSIYLSDIVQHEYTYLSSLFSSIEGRTVENYFIEQRIEKAKELLTYNQLTLSQIAFDLDYSSVAHLSSQFKRITGLTPSYFREIGKNKRKALDKI